MEGESKVDSYVASPFEVEESKEFLKIVSEKTESGIYHVQAESAGLSSLDLEELSGADLLVTSAPSTSVASTLNFYINAYEPAVTIVLKKTSEVDESVIKVQIAPMPTSIARMLSVVEPVDARDEKIEELEAKLEELSRPKKKRKKTTVKA